MGRKRKDIIHEEAIKRLLNVINRRDFIESFDLLFGTWSKAGFPEFVSEDRKIRFDRRRKRMVYYGLYYDLREICDNYGLVWPIDGAYLERMLMMKKSGEYKSAHLKPIDIPEKRDWEWFRIARTGLGLPSEENKHELRNLGLSSLTSKKEERSLNVGFTYENIAELYGVDPRTVQNAIAKCWEYLISPNVDFNHLINVLGEDGDEIGVLIRLNFEIEERKNKRKNKPK